MKKIISVFAIICILITSVSGLYSFALDNPSYAQGITTEMCSASYWYDKGLADSDKVLMSFDEIKAANKAAVDGKGTNVIDLMNIKEDYDATSLKDSLSNISVPKSDLFIDGLKIDKTAFIKNISDAIKATGYDGQQKTQFAVCVSTGDMKAYPEDKFLGYSENDPDDENESVSLCVNEPFAIRQKCEINGKVFYWGYGYNCTGWINAESLAICKNRNEWYDACKVDLDGKDFLVVTKDRIITEPSILAPYSSEVTLNLGTILKLIPADEIPDIIGERGTWNNYAVYLPTRDSQGKYVKKPALISQHHTVSIGFLPFTQKNLLDVAFSCLGNRYGWAGCLNSMDCSLYIRNIYRCFGFEIPRNTTWQQLVPGTLIDMKDMDDVQREQLIETLPIGTALYFDGHTMMYIGTEDGMNYVISDLGTVVESTGDIKVKTVYSVAINPMSVRRGNGYTWLHNLTSAVVYVPEINISECDIDAVRNNNGEVIVTVSYDGKTLYEGVNYSAEVSESRVTVSGRNFFTGEKTVKINSPAESILKKIISFFKKILVLIVSIFIK